MVEELRAENEQLRLYAGLDTNGTTSTPNSSSKRRRLDAYKWVFTGGRSIPAILYFTQR